MAKYHISFEKLRTDVAKELLREDGKGEAAYGTAHGTSPEGKALRLTRMYSNGKSGGVGADGYEARSDGTTGFGAPVAVLSKRNGLRLLSETCFPDQK
jgi:hypothetical protein